MPFYLCIKENLDARGIFTEETRMKIIFRERIHDVLDELPRTCDKLTVEVFRNGDTLNSVLEKLKLAMDEAFANFSSLFPDSTDAQLEWIKERFDRLVDVLKDRGERHVTDLGNERHRHYLREEGGDGYTIRFVGKEWSIYNYA